MAEGLTVMVLNRANMTFMGEDNILDQICEKQILLDFHYQDF